MRRRLGIQTLRRNFACRLSNVSICLVIQGQDNWVCGTGANTGPVHCSMLAEDAIKSAISNYYTKNPNAKVTDLGGTNAPMPKVEVETVTAPPTAAAAV